MTEEEADNIKNNLWLYRLRRRLTRNAFCKGIMVSSDYRLCEYGHTPFTHEQTESFAQKLSIPTNILYQKPDYAALLDIQMRKLIEYYRLALTQKQRGQLVHLLKGFIRAP